MTLIQKNIEQIKNFLWRINRADGELAREIVSVHADTLKEKLSDVRPKERENFISFLRGTVLLDDKLAQEIDV